MIQAVVFFCIVNKQTKIYCPTRHFDILSFSATCFVLHEPSSVIFVYNNLKNMDKFQLLQVIKCMGAAICEIKLIDFSDWIHLVQDRLNDWVRLVQDRLQ
jgi:hypothetical protein